MRGTKCRIVDCKFLRAITQPQIVSKLMKKKGIVTVRNILKKKPTICYFFFYFEYNLTNRSYFSVVQHFVHPFSTKNSLNGFCYVIPTHKHFSFTLDLIEK